MTDAPRGSAPVPAAIIPAPGPEVPREAVRRRLADGVLSDVVGHVLRDDADALVLLPLDGPPVRLHPRDVVARRVVPPRAVRPSSSAEAIERIAAAGWPGLAVSRLGGWIIREGRGWTGRANSCLVAGEPGLPVPEALDLVAVHYERAGLTPRVQLTHPAGEPPDHRAAAVEQAVDAAGWVASDLTHVLVTDLRRRADVAAAPADQEAQTSQEETDGGLGVHWSDEVGQDWARIVRGGEVADDPRALPVLTAVPARYLLLRDPHGSSGEAVGSPGEAICAGRLVLTQDWAGLSCIEVVPDRRGAGLGGAVTRAMLQEARRAGARFAYVQVEDGNPAVSLYRRLGFTPHHRYHYRVLHAGS